MSFSSKFYLTQAQIVGEVLFDYLGSKELHLWNSFGLIETSDPKDLNLQI